MKKGFGLIQAIFFILIISFVGIIAIEYSKISTKITTDTYLKEQAEAFMQSAIEFSILAVLNFDRTTGNGCLEEVNITSKDTRFLAHVRITDYMVHELDLSYCNVNFPLNSHEVNEGLLPSNRNHQLNGSGILHVVVTSNDSNYRMKDSKIRLVKRVWQKF